MLRDPLEQCRSAYGYDALLKAMTEEPSCAFYEVLSKRDAPVRKLWNYHPCNTSGHYMEAVSRWQNATLRENLLILDSAEFGLKPLAVIRRVERFLRIPHFRGFERYIRNIGRMHMSTRAENKTVEDLPQAHCLTPFRNMVTTILKRENP